MKKLRFISMMCLLALFVVSLVGCKKEDVNNNGNNNGNGGSGGGGSAQTGYVDLGLPSGTKWKVSNEKGNGTGFYTFDEAISTFGDKLPSIEQWDELIEYCTWTWVENSGLKATGTNGNSIILTTEGRRYCDGNIEPSRGDYWASTPLGPEVAWSVCLISGDSYQPDTDEYERCEGHSVRLVQD